MPREPWTQRARDLARACPPRRASQSVELLVPEEPSQGASFLLALEKIRGTSLTGEGKHQRRSVDGCQDIQLLRGIGATKSDPSRQPSQSVAPRREGVARRGRQASGRPRTMGE